MLSKEPQIESGGGVFFSKLRNIPFHVKHWIFWALQWRHSGAVSNTGESGHGESEMGESAPATGKSAPLAEGRPSSFPRSIQRSAWRGCVSAQKILCTQQTAAILTS